MSPLQAMERSYAALKALMRDGRYPPGYRLEANRIADEIGVSMTPVRDALNRLVGEQLVEASSGDGFYVPRLSEGDLRDLYEWHSAIIIMAVRTARALPAAEDIHAAMAKGESAEATSAYFALLAEGVSNIELRRAILNVGDRLHPFRRIESMVIEPAIGDLKEAILSSSRQRPAIRRYHLARMRAVPDLVRARAVRK